MAELLRPAPDDLLEVIEIGTEIGNPSCSSRYVRGFCESFKGMLEAVIPAEAGITVVQLRTTAS